MEALVAAAVVAAAVVTVAVVVPTAVVAVAVAVVVDEDKQALVTALHLNGPHWVFRIPQVPLH